MAIMGSGSARGENRAVEAAQKAISSPLLEDINLEGARGILVNVTAGMDLSIGEFNEVGSTVKQRASDDATVVIGTVIDPAMEGEVRVTVVATGLGGVAARQPKPEMQIVSTGRERERERGRKVAGSDVDYGAYEVPTSRRREQQGGGTPSADSGMLDIPAFLRRQAD